MASPRAIREKFEREWLANKETAITNYAAQASGWYAKILASKAKMIANYTTALSAGGTWESGIAKYESNFELLSESYRSAMDNITSISPAKLLKVEEDAELKQYLGNQADEVYTLLGAAESGSVTYPAVGKGMILSGLIQAINSNQNSLSTNSTPAQILVAITTYLTTTLLFPNKA